MDEKTKGRRRAEDVQPSGYNSTRITEPPAVPAEALAVLELTEAHEEIGLTRMLHATGALSAVDVQVMLAGASAKMGRALRLLTAGALVAAFLAAGLVVGGPSAGRAEAAEGPEPDPVAGVSVAARTVPVVLSAAPVTVYVRATVYTETAPSLYCGSVWSARGILGRACSIGRAFPIPVTIDPRTFPAGRTFAQVVDDASDVAVSNVILDARRPSRFGRGTWLDLGRGDEFVSAPLAAYTASVGAWTPQRYSPVQVQEIVAGRWVVRATLTTTAQGVASGVVHLGGGVRRVRVVRQAGATVWSATGTTRTVAVTTEPLDVI